MSLTKTKTIKDIFAGIKANIPDAALDLKINNLNYDSRKVKPGGLFIAVSGFKIDGHNFLKDVEKSGAAAAVVEKIDERLSIPQIKTDDTRRAMAYLAYNFYKPEIESLQLVGITGTNGKTTTSFLVRSMLEKAGFASGLIGTIAYHYGSKQAAEAWNTTPESVDLCAMLYEMINNNQRACILEVSSHALSLHRVDGLKFKIGLFTNLSRDHLDFHKTEEEYFKAKARLFSLLSEDGAAVINIDDEYGRRLLKQIEHPVYTFGLSKEADIKVRSWNMDISGMQLNILTPKGELDIQTKLISSFNIQNILSAVATGTALNLGLDVIKQGIEDVESVPGRLQKYEVSPGILAVVDYAHSPDALEKALQALRQITKKRLITVFGCGGDRDKGKRPLMGRIAEKLADYIIVTDDNPRTEDRGAIINDILKGISNPHKCEVIMNRREAIFKALKIAEQGDIILIAGKGHESYQEINGIKYDFNEVEIIREAAQNA